MNKEVKVWKSSLKQQEVSPETTKTKYDIRLEQTKRKVRTAALEWDDFVLQEQLKYLMYVECSLRGNTKKDKFIDELNLKNCVRLNRKTTIKFFVGITKKRKFIIHPECFDANNLFSHPFIKNIKYKPNTVQDL